MGLIGCPFCGNTHDNGVTKWGHGFRVECVSCGAMGGTHMTSQEAHEAWVQRPIHPDTAALARLERKVTAIIEWLESNQPDVFKRGLWEALRKEEGL
jgi:hypothetical protein